MLECAQNLACVGAEPLGLTNCLNFGNPEKPVPAWQLDRAISGLAEVCEELGVPVVGGNVSLYNEGPDGPIYPTPVVSMVGELPDPAKTAPSSFAKAGDAIALLGPFSPTMHGSELAKQRGELALGLPKPDVAAVAAACATVREAVRAGKVASAHDVSDGGLASALAECSIGAGIGCRADLQDLRERGCTPEEALFGEGPGGFVLSGDRAELEALGALVIGDGRRHHDRARRRRPQPDRRRHRRDRGLALAGRSGRIGRRASRRRLGFGAHAAPRPRPDRGPRAALRLERRGRRRSPEVRAQGGDSDQGLTRPEGVRARQWPPDDR